MPAKKNSPGTFSGYIKKIRKIAGLNIGTAIFAVLFIYMLFSAVLYLTSTHIESYQVAVGPLSRNETYTGLAVREEKTVRADSGGYVTYYAREGNKINANGVVYGLSASKIPETQTKLSSEELSRIRDDMMSFSKGFDVVVICRVGSKDCTQKEISDALYHLGRRHHILEDKE